MKLKNLLDKTLRREGNREFQILQNDNKFYWKFIGGKFGIPVLTVLYDVYREIAQGYVKIL